MKEGSKTKLKIIHDKCRAVGVKALFVVNKIINHLNISSKEMIVYPLLYFIGIIIYLEIILHLIITNSIDVRIIYPILFAFPLGILITFFIGLFKEKVNRVMMWIVAVVLCLLFCLQLIYYYIFKNFFSFQVLGMAGDAVSEFNKEIFEAIRLNIGGVLLLIVPLPVLAMIHKQYINNKKRDRKTQGILLGVCMLFHIIALGGLFLYGTEDHTPYDVYHKTRIIDMCGKQLGIVTMTRLDLTQMVMGEKDLVLTNQPVIHWDVKNEPTLDPTQTEGNKPTRQNTKGGDLITEPTPAPTSIPTPTPIDTTPNVMNIDFRTLANMEKNTTIQTLHNYFASVTPTNKNEYTGMFQGYNLILITAEGFAPYAVHKEKTPTLYKLTQEGFIFRNFYTALWQTSTSDGEYVALTGLIPVGTRSMYHSRKNLHPFSLGHQFNKLGIKSRAYHNHTYTYYQRNETHPNLGYSFKAKGNGLELKSNVWPGSDLEMMEATIDEYINEDPFYVYYLTVSGHMNYTFSGNSMSYKNKVAVSDLPYTSDARAYLACQMELDKALELLITRLDQAGVLENTVIALSADHHPYGLEKKKLDELAGYVVDPVFDIYRNHFILWNAGMKESIIVDKPCSSLDILPTLSNLFGLEYDSRLLMGRDILSDSDPLVILSNRSFITDKVKYNATNRKITYLTDEKLPEDYIRNINAIIKDKFSISESIVKRDYYRYVFSN